MVIALREIPNAASVIILYEQFKGGDKNHMV